MATSGSGLLIPPRYIPYIANTAAIVNVIPIFAGLYGVVRPKAMYTALNFPEPKDERDVRLAEGLAKMYAVRQFGIGMGTLSMWYFGAYRAMGLSSLAAGVLLASVDGMVSKEVSGHHVMGHWAGAVMAMIFGTTLLGLV